MPFGPVDPDLDLPTLEQRRLERWKADDTIGATRRLRAGGEPWIFYEGPPTANGRPGLHHVWARVFKDIYPRFQTMRGRDVPRKGGWDCHGLPVELEVEKELGLSTKQDIEEFGIAEFNQRCRESVQRYVTDWTALTERSGVWIDTADAYWTLDNSYVESVWWLIRQLWDKGLLYEGHKVSPYCGRCGTALSSHELGQPDVYRDVVDPSVYVRFPIVDRDVDLLVWTTTPWTLISNVAAAVGPDIDYARVASTDGTRDLVMAAALAPDDAIVVETFKGSDLVGWRYERPFDTLTPPAGSDGWRVVAAEFVTTDDGSGIVHLAPAFGEDDAAVGRAENLPVLNPVNADAAFDASVPAFTGRFVKDADRDIIADLSTRGLLVREQAYEHSYPHCWRCSTPLIYWAKTSWFVRTSQNRDLLMRENERIEWHPEFIKHGRFGKWLEGNIDWALSRDRYWGTPLPIWRCDANGHEHCIGSVEELSALTSRDLTELDLHRPHVDNITFTCSTDSCAGTMRRVAPVLDAWFDSGAMPSAQRHHPFENADSFNGAFPADFICEAIDQTRGWFYSLLAVNSLVFDSTPYKNVVCLALIVDENGQKMSKSRGNVIAPSDIFDTLGADALRWYFFSSGQPWTPRRVFNDGIREATRQTLLTLWNVFSFFATYADLDGWQPDPNAPAPTHVLDRWILSELDDTVTSVTAALENFDALGGSGRIARFVDDLSNWYVRRSRPRFWKSSDTAAHATLYECLTTISQVLAPFCPFLADEIYTTLTTSQSVHLTDWPVAKGRHDASLAEQMDAARRLVSLGRSARTDAKMKVRQPLSRALLLHGGTNLDEAIEAEIKAELNVKNLERLDSLSGLMGWTVIPNFRLLGPRLGPRVNEIKAALADADGSALQAQLVENGWIEIAGERLTTEEVEVRAEKHADLALVEDDGWAVALDLELNDELRAEGTARELVRALNDARKSAGLEIADRIAVTIDADETLRAVINTHRETITTEILARSIEFGNGDRTIEIDGTTLSIGLIRVD
ncbi:MAG: isoleucine--tRNA ligase [Actinomycetia bacterium]|nr:isoleucine--tRNA ligase [Actinomycetes bacterium]